MGEKSKAVEESRLLGIPVITEGEQEAARSDDAAVPAAEVRQLKKRIRKLERVLGKKTLENEILTETVKLANEKKLISRMPLLPEDDFPMKAIARALGVVRSYLVEQTSPQAKPARCRYNKTDDVRLLHCDDNSFHRLFELLQAIKI